MTLGEAGASGSEHVHRETPASPSAPDRIDELLPHATPATRARIREVAADIAQARSMSLADAQLAVIKAWSGTLDGEATLLRGEAHLLLDKLKQARPRASATGRLARYVHAGREGKRRPLHRLLWRLFLPHGLGPFYS